MNYSVSPIIDMAKENLSYAKEQACQECADAALRSLHISHYLVLAAFFLLIISRWASISDLDNWADNIGLIIIGVCSLYWLLG